MKRYNFTLESVHGGEWQEIERVDSELGAYVLYDDHLKAMEELKKEILLDIHVLYSQCDSDECVVMEDVEKAIESATIEDKDND